MVHLGRNSSEVIPRLGYLGAISRGVLAPLLQGLSGLIVAAVLVAGLLAYQPTLVLGLEAVFLATYGAMARLNRRRLHRISVLSDHYSQRSLKAQQEGLVAIRDVLLDGCQPLYVDTYRRAQRPLMLLQAEADTVAGLPRFALEAASMVAIAGSVLWLLPRGWVVAALPAVQYMYGASTYLGAYRDALAGGLELVEQGTPLRVFAQPASPVAQPEVLPFEKGLKFRQVEFCHQGGVAVLQGIDLSIRPGAWISLVGATGSGKSTLLDLLMGLLSPSLGQICVDGLPLEEPAGSIDRRSAWQRHLAHVPQTIFLADASIAANIAFCLPPEQVDLERLDWAAASAQAKDFISKPPQGFDTPVGEQGVRLSGGQR
ncbi:ABC transporter ATP-binding protein [Microcystis elabens FACHB-917]|nr:ABC transporter ATP-binding protein [Microcystis elabens FACHB-917]